MWRATAVVTLVFAAVATAQQAGFRGGFGGPGMASGFQGVPSLPIHPGSTAGLPLLGPIPPLGGVNPGFRPGFDGGVPVSGGGAFPIFWGGYGGYQTSYAPITNIVMVPAQSAPAAVAPAPPPLPVRAEVREYKEFQGVSDTALNPVEVRFFVLAMKDGSRPTASLVWVQGADLVYVTPGGEQVRVPAGQVDRERTRQLNLARNLNLRLP